MPPKDKEVQKLAFGRVKNNLKMGTKNSNSGIVGLPNVGKSSLFNLLTSQNALAANYPFATIEPNDARCPVPDARYDHLCSIWKPPSEQPAYLHVTDIAGLIKGASEGAGLGNNFLSHIQGVDGIYHMVRVFDDADIVHVDDSIDALRDLETITEELCKKDLEFVNKAIAVEEIAVKKSGGRFKLSPNFFSATEKLIKLLSENKPVRMGDWTTPEIEVINEKMQLITTKPIIYLANMSATDFIKKKNKWLAKIHAWIQSHGGGVLIPFSVEFEQQLLDLSRDQDAQQDFLKKPGQVSQLPKMITTGYKELNLIYYFTAGEKEVRAWTVYSGSPSPEAAAVIHTDFGKAFIKAEVCAYEDFKALSDGTKSLAPIKAAGKYRQEGKTYIVKDGDIIHFQIGTIAKKK